MQSKVIVEKGPEGYHERAYGYIKSRIMNMEYKPGETLSEVEISKELGISRTPVREALRRLTSEGFVQWIPNRGRVVYTLSLHDIEEIFALKQAVETMLVRQVAIARSEEDLSKLQEAIDGMETAAKNGDTEKWFEFDGLYHSTLFVAANNERARQIVGNLNEQWHRVRIGFVTLEGRMNQSVSEHREIAEAIAQGDPDRAEQATRKHLDDIRSTLINLIKSFVMPYVGENL